MQQNAGDNMFKLSKQKKVLDNLVAKKLKLDDALTQAKLTLDKQQRLVAAIQAQVSEKEDAARKQETLMSALQATLDKLAKDRNSINEQQQLLRVKVTQQRALHQKADQQATDAARSIADLDQRMQTKSFELKRIQEQITLHQKSLEVAVQAKTKLTNEAIALSAKAAVAEKERDRLKNQIDATNRHLQVTTQQHYNKNAELDAAKQKLAQVLESEAAQNVELAKQKALLNQKQAELKAATQDFEAANRDLLNVANEVNHVEQMMLQFAQAFSNASTQAADGLRNETAQHAVVQGEEQKTKTTLWQKIMAATFGTKMQEMATVASQKHASASEAHQQADKVLSSRLDATMKAAQRLSQCAKNASNAQKERDRRVCERTEKRNDKTSKDQQVRQQEEERRRLEARRSGFWKIVSWIVSALSRVCNLLGMLIPQLRAAGLALSIIEGIVSQVESVVSQCAESLEHAVREQEEKDREHNIAMTDEERARHESILMEIAEMRQIGRANDAARDASNATRAHDGQRTSEERQRSLEEQLKGVSGQLNNEVTKAQSVLDGGRSTAEEKKRAAEQATRRRDELQKELRSSNREVTTAEAELTAAEQQIKATAARLAETAAQRQALQTQVDVIAGTEAEARASLVELEQKHTDSASQALKFKEDAASIKDQATQADNNLRSIEQELGSLRATAVTIADDIRIASQSKDSHEQDRRTAASARDAAASIIAQAEVDDVALARQLADNDLTHQSTSAAQGSANNACRDAKQAADALNGSLKTAQEKVDEATANLNKSQADVNAVSSSIEKTSDLIDDLESTTPVHVPVPVPARRDDPVYN